MNALEIKDLTKSYPGFTLDHLNLTLPSGCIMGLVGENGYIHGMDHFGYSAPYKVLDEKFGYNGETVYNEVKQLLAK